MQQTHPNHHLSSRLVALIAGGLLVCATSSAQTFSLLNGLADYQVFQRGATDTVTFRVEGSATANGIVKVSVTSEEKLLENFNRLQIGTAAGGSWKGLISSLPTGGPYAFEFVLEATDGSKIASHIVQRVLVGDLWLLGGQSNMEGVGDMINVEEPSERINVYRMRHQWDEASEPIHRLYESVDRVHFFDRRGESPLPSLEEANKTAAASTKGAGLGLPFAKQMVARTGIPIGLVPVAHGGTSMEQWNPDHRDKGGDSLYGSFLSAFKAVGGKVRGMLWYQGESDAGNDELPKTFTPSFIRLVEAIRQDTGDPNLPFFYVQIGCVAQTDPPLPFTPANWNSIQDQQRSCETLIPNVGVVTAVDLALDDLIHIGTDGLKRLGKRLANLALGSPSAGPRFDRVEKGEGFYRVVFKGGTGKLMSPKGRVSGFSIRSKAGEDLSRIYKAAVDPDQPNSVLLYITAPPAEGYLWYGYGLMPFCNLTDTEDMAALVMGPVDLPK
ncbi:MAG: 9-O-acetylesterase [Candidatus Hinthialibacteria bacterium]